MDTLPAAQLSRTASKPQSNSDDIGTRKQAAEWAVKTFLRGYPDFGKAPPGYVASLMDVVERYPVDVIRKLADPQVGVSVKYPDYLPTSGQVVELADRFLGQVQTAEKYSAIKAERKPERLLRGPLQCPFPKLGEAFPNVDWRSFTFDQMSTASYRLATQGAQSAFDYLDAMSGKAPAPEAEVMPERKAPWEEQKPASSELLGSPLVTGEDNAWRGR